MQSAANAFIDLMAPAMSASGQMKLIVNTQLRSGYLTRGVQHCSRE
jgi:hypothetical protein